MSYHVTQPSPALVLQATNAGVRRPGYEASSEGGKSLCAENYSVPDAHEGAESTANEAICINIGSDF